MYSLRNLAQKNPIQISGVVIAWLNVLVIAGTIDVSAETVSSLNIALVLTLGLFVAVNTANKTALDEFLADMEKAGVQPPPQDRPLRASKRPSGG